MAERLHVLLSGRKKAALAYVVMYTSGCVTKHFNDFNILLAGRLFSGIATSLLNSAFESWLVAEHSKVSNSLSNQPHAQPDLHFKHAYSTGHCVVNLGW